MINLNWEKISIKLEYLKLGYFCIFKSGLLLKSANGPDHAKKCLMPYANNKGAGQPAHPHGLISTFVVRCLDSMMCILAISKVS